MCSGERTGRRCLLITAAFAAGLAIAGPAAAAPQSTHGTIRGVVRDATKATMPGVSVTLTSLDAGRMLRQRTVADGAFRFMALAPGRYRLDATRDGFTPAAYEIDLSVDQDAPVDVLLTIARQTDTVDVRVAPPPLIEASNTSLGRTFASREIDGLPIPALAASRSFLALIGLTPGILPLTFGVANAGVTTAGQPPNANTFLIDGLSVDGGGELNGSPSMDTILELRVVSNHADAEFGQASGAVVNVVTRSGTNTSSGRLYSFVQIPALNADSALAKTVNASDAAPSQSTAGGFWGGPLVKNHLFLFGSNEQVIVRRVYVNGSQVTQLFRPGERQVFRSNGYQPTSFLRLDANLGSANVLTVRGSHQTTTAGNAAREINSTAERGRRTLNPINDVALLDTHTMGSRAVNEIRAHWNEDRFIWFVDGYCPNCATLNYPDLKLGKPANAPQLVINARRDIADVLTWSTGGPGGPHATKAGFSAGVPWLHGWNPVNMTGTYRFTNNLPFSADASATYPAEFTQNVGDPRVGVRERIVSAFIQDHWPIRERISLDLGLRWDRTFWPSPASRRDDVSPRVGIAINPGRSGHTVVRAAGGRYYDERQLQIANLAESGFTILSILNPGFQGDAINFDPRAPSLNRTGSAIELHSTNSGAITQTPYTDQTSAGIQQQFGEWMGVTADLVAARGYRLPVGRDLNYPDPASHIRPSFDPTLKQVIVTETTGRTWYTGLQVGVQMRPGPATSIVIAYTTSLSEDNTDGPRAFPEDQLNQAADRGPAIQDARHSLTASATVRAPFGFRIGTVVAARSSRPYNITTGLDDNRDGVKNDRPRTPDQLALCQCAGGRNDARGGPSFQADLRISRMISTSHGRIELLVEAFNVTNYANWTDYNGAMTSIASKTFKTPSTVGSARQVQVGLRFDFGGRRQP